MHPSHNYTCHQCSVAERDGKTMPITTLWRETMVAERQRRGFNQVQLAKRIGASQSQISRIEQGQVMSSDLVLDICRVLSIAPPSVSTDDAQREWMELGAALARNSPELFRTALELAERILMTVEKKPQK